MIFLLVRRKIDGGHDPYALAASLFCLDHLNANIEGVVPTGGGWARVKHVEGD